MLSCRNAWLHSAAQTGHSSRRLGSLASWRRPGPSLGFMTGASAASARTCSMSGCSSLGDGAPDALPAAALAEAVGEFPVSAQMYRTRLLSSSVASSNRNGNRTSFSHSGPQPNTSVLASMKSNEMPPRSATSGRLPPEELAAPLPVAVAGRCGSTRTPAAPTVGRSCTPSSVPSASASKADVAGASAVGSSPPAPASKRKG
mmetsp:Transcript_120069/g.336151  ORF Transcript_120069/g.336151 Transcript_120069/m.336151 type:complete len:202 (-) Transcript_120069:869-1474(-)